MNAPHKSHPVFARVTDEALAARPDPELGQNVYAFAPRMVSKPGHPFPVIERVLLSGRVFHVGTPDPAWPGLGTPVDIALDRECVGRIDSIDLRHYKTYGYITRTGIGWFSSVEEAARRESYIDAPGIGYHASV